MAWQKCAMDGVRATNLAGVVGTISTGVSQPQKMNKGVNIIHFLSQKPPPLAPDHNKMLRNINAQWLQKTQL